MDPFRHPDLERLGRALRSRLDETLDAEQLAALAAARRRRTLRDVCIEAEDRAADIFVSTVDGQVLRGRIVAVGVDHIELVDGRANRHIALGHVISLEVR